MRMRFPVYSRVGDTVTILVSASYEIGNTETEGFIITNNAVNSLRSEEIQKVNNVVANSINNGNIINPLFL